MTSYQESFPGEIHSRSHTLLILRIFCVRDSKSGKLRRTNNTAKTILKSEKKSSLTNVFQKSNQHNNCINFLISIENNEKLDFNVEVSTGKYSPTSGKYDYSHGFSPHKYANLATLNSATGFTLSRIYLYQIGPESRNSTPSPK
jgi:hypothetical protein